MNEPDWKAYYDFMIRVPDARGRGMHHIMLGADGWPHFVDGLEFLKLRTRDGVKLLYPPSLYTHNFSG